jgi:hypothetical protein
MFLQSTDLNRNRTIEHRRFDSKNLGGVEGWPPRLGDYLQLPDWTGRQILSDKRGVMPANLEPLIERPGISTELWVDCVLNFRKWFRSSVGRPKSMESAAEKRGQNRAISINSALRAFT